MYQQLDPRQESTHRSLAGRTVGDPRTLNEKCPDARWMDRRIHKGDADQICRRGPLRTCWGPSSMQVVDRTIAGRLLVQLNRVGGEAGLVDPPGNDGDMVAEVGGDGASKGDAVVKHHVRVVHDDVCCRVRLLNGCKESKHQTKECKINQLNPEKNGVLVQEP